MFDSCKIRVVSPDDLPLILEWRNHPEIRRFMFTQHEISLDEHQNWFMKSSKDFTRLFYIVEEAQQPIGYVQFNNVARGGVADWGFYVRPGAPRGTGRKMGVTALCHAFEVLDLHKVCAQAIESNSASIAFHKRLGFFQEGALREQQYINGVYHTVFCFGLLADEWQPKRLFQGKNDAKD